MIFRLAILVLTKADKNALDDPKNVKLVAMNACFGVSLSSEHRAFNTFNKFNKIVQVPEDIHMDFKFVPHPSLADTATATLHKENFPSKMTYTASILKTPKDFSASFLTTEKKSRKI